jgi:hypothetical protein
MKKILFSITMLLASANLLADNCGCKVERSFSAEPAPVCQKMVPVETCAERHDHVHTTYSCPVGYDEIAVR